VERVFVDTSAWVAYANKREPNHRRVREALREWAGRLVTSNLVFGETVTFFLYSVRHDVAVTVGQALLDPRNVALFRATAEDEHKAWALFRARRDQRYSFTDCVSFVMMRRLGISSAVSLDDDFRREGFATRP
jgi:predicted nucleic acid-binding protein